MSISPDQLRASFPANVFAAAQAYVRAGRVTQRHLDPDGNALTALVQGSATKPYRQTIRFRHGNGRKWAVVGRCTCPVGRNCKHVAAALLAQALHPEALHPEALLGNGAVEVASPPPVRAAALQTRQRRISQAPEAPGVTPDIAAWLLGLADDTAAESDDYPPNVSQRLFYLLSQAVPAGHKAPALAIGLASADFRRDGTLGTSANTPRIAQLLMPDDPPLYVRPIDRALLRQLNAWPLDGRGAGAQDFLRQMLETGRARVGATFPGIAARQSEARAGTLEWRMAADGTQTPALSITGGGVPVLLPAPWYLDQTTGEIGEILIDVPPLMLQRMLSAPPVRAEHAVAVRTALAKSMPGSVLTPPAALPHGGRLGGRPAPVLTLKRLSLGFHADLERRFGGAGLDVSFRYGPVTIPARHTGAEVVAGGTLYTLVRHRTAESAADKMLKKLNFISLAVIARYVATLATSAALVLHGDHAEAHWLDFLVDTVPMLRGMGWDIVVAPDFPYRLIEPTGTFDAELREGSGIDWFDLNLGVLVGEERIDLVPPLLALLKGAAAANLIARLRTHHEVDDRKMVLSLPDGRRLVLPAFRIAPVLLTLFDLFGAGGLSAENGRLGVSRTGAAGLAALEQAGLAAGLVWRGGEAIRALGRMLRERGGIPSVPVPAWFQAELRPYQARGVDWLQFLRQAGLAGVLADDMGLGKTVQTLAHLAVEKAAGRLTAPALVICPTSVVGNWVREAARFVPDFRVLALQGTDRKARFADIAASDLVISTYPLLTRDADILTGQDWHALILDEAQTVKNPAASMAQTVRRLRAGQRICLTGTPMENHLGELWALFDFMMPGFLGTQQEFGRRFRTPIEKGGDTERHAALARRVSPFLLRRNKSDVATDLPPRTDIVEDVQMGAAQRAIYEGIRMAMHVRVQQAIAQHGLAKSGIVILDALLKLRQACCDPRLLKIAASTRQKAGSAKLERLLELLGTLQDEGRSILLFSQFTSMLALIEEQLKARDMRYVLLTGETRQRAQPIDAFQSGRVKLFLISLKAGGVGLNLTAADTVIHYDPWWNPAAENQATDRAHRIGQTKSVFVHRLITENSIEEKMEVLKARKSALAEGILNGAGTGALRMTERDVEMLFG